ncbi:hypothetical protein V6N13_143383 [Hibiscus sabdariffa]|uniref:Uncharacterized protein n=1 Tax=Hibiscus sabdariffa TaxID=183260 RepID=A0ABR2FHQ5_9ROSI
MVENQDINAIPVLALLSYRAFPHGPIRYPVNNGVRSDINAEFDFRRNRARFCMPRDELVKKADQRYILASTE